MRAKTYTIPPPTGLMWEGFLFNSDRRIAGICSGFSGKAITAMLLILSSRYWQKQMEALYYIMPGRLYFVGLKYAF